MDSRLKRQSPPPPSVYDLGDCVFNAEHAELLSKKSSKQLHIEKKVAEVFECLAKAKGKVVTRDEIFDHVWPQMIVSDDSLNRCISVLRKNLKSFNHQLSVKTHPKVGFNLESPCFHCSHVDNYSPRAHFDRRSDVSHAPISSYRLVFGACILVSLLSVVLFWLVLHKPLVDGDSATLGLNKGRIIMLPITMSGELGEKYKVFESELRHLMAQLPDIELVTLAGSAHWQKQDPRTLSTQMNARFIFQGSVYANNGRELLDWQLVDGSNGSVISNDLLNLSLNNHLINTRHVITQLMFDQSSIRFGSANKEQADYLVAVAQQLFYPASHQEFQRPVINLLARVIQSLDENNINAIKTLSRFIAQAQWSAPISSRPHIHLAINLLTKALPNHPTDVDIYQILANLHLSIYQWSAAHQILLQSITRLPANGHNADIILFDLARYTGQLTQAQLTSLTSIYQEQPLAQDAAFDLIRYYLDSGMQTEALKLADVATFSDQQWQNLAPFLGPLYLRAGNDSKGSQLLRLGYDKMGLRENHIALLKRGILEKDFRHTAFNLLEKSANNNEINARVFMQIAAELSNLDTFYQLANTLADSYQFDVTLINRIQPNALRQTAKYANLMNKIGLTKYWQDSYFPYFCEQAKVQCQQRPH